MTRVIINFYAVSCRLCAISSVLVPMLKYSPLKSRDRNSPNYIVLLQTYIIEHLTLPMAKARGSVKEAFQNTLPNTVPADSIRSSNNT